MSKITSFAGIDIVIRTRDEHCDPHVHAFHLAEGWEMRFFFSYATDRIMKFDVCAGRAPKQKTVQACMNKVIDNLDKCRELFWDAVKNTCLQNQYLFVAAGVVHLSAAGASGAMLVNACSYIATKRSIRFSFAGSPIALTAKCP